MSDLLKELRDLICDAQTFCATLGRVENLPTQVDTERQVLASRFRRAEVTICHSMTQDKRIRKESSENEKQGSKKDTKSPKCCKHTVISPAKVSENAEQEQGEDSPHEYIEMSPPSRDTVGIALSENGHLHSSTHQGEETDARNKQSESRDSLELLEEEEEGLENALCQDSVVLRHKVGDDKAIADTKDSESNSPRSDSSKMQRRTSLSILRNWKARVSGSRKDKSAKSPRERLGSRVEKQKLPMEKINNPEICGYLRKRDKKMGRWQRRWCVVKGDQFFYAEKETDRFTCDAFSLKGYNIKSGNTSANKLQHVIELVHTEHPPFQFAATSSEDMDRWIGELRRAAGLIDSYEVPKEFDPETLAQLQHKQEEMDANRQCQTPPLLPGEEDRCSRSPQLYEAIFDFDGGEEDELPFRKGDLLLIEEGGNEHWLVGSLHTNNDEASAGTKRFVPSSYLQPISSNDDANTKL